MRALITGGTGFVGRHLADHLDASGDDVVAADRATDPPLDVTDPTSVEAVVSAARPDVVYHLAARSHVGESWADPTTTFRVNAEGALHVLEAAARHGVARVLVVGSADEYGAVRPKELPLREDAPLRPITPYAASKIAAEYLALQAFHGRGQATIRVRAFNHTGPGQSARFALPALAARVARAECEGAETVAIGSTDPVRDLLDVRDVVRAYRLIVTGGEPGEVYNVCSGTGRRIGDLAAALLARSAPGLRLEVDPELVRPVDVPALVGDPARLRAATGWEPAIPFEDTLADLLEAARAAARTPE